jgi:hypothetical protein
MKVTLAMKSKTRMLFVTFFMLSGCSLSPAPANPNAKPRPVPEQNREEPEIPEGNGNEPVIPEGPGNENVTATAPVLNKTAKINSEVGAQTTEVPKTTEVPVMSVACADVPDTVDSSQTELPQNDLQKSDRSNGYKGHFIGDGRRHCWKSGRCDAFGNPKNKCDARKNYFGLQTNPEDFSVVNVPPEVPSNCGCTIPTK